MKITEYAVHRRLATCALLMALLVLGFYGLWGLPVNFLPDITYPMIRLHISWRGATPEEIETNVADPIERQMSTLDNLESLESSSIEGMYTLRINFAYGVDVNIAYQDALEAMGRVARQLPADIDPPVMFKADPTQLPILQLTVRSDQWDLVRLRDWADNWLQDQLLAVPGVAGTEVIGGMKREIRVHLNPEALEKHHLSLPRIVQRLRDENIDQFGGRVTTGQREIIARTEGEFQNVEEIRNVVLARNGHALVRLHDVAEVEDSHEETRVITRLDGDPCVKVSVLKQADANTVEVARATERRIAQLQPLLPPGLELGIVESQADYVESALAGVTTTAIQAAILLIVVVYLFMGSWRQVLVMVIALPVTLVLNFGLMRLSGFSLNIFSLGGLVIAIGVLLSNTIVVVENITRWRATRPDLDKSQAVIGATSEVGSPILAATLTFLALFVPFLLVPGLTSLLFRELILVIAGIVAISLGVAVSLTPMLTAVFLKSTTSQASGRFARFFDRVTEGYGGLLGGALRARWAVVPAFLIVLAIAWFVVLPRLGGEFLPRMDDGRVMVKVRMPTGAALGQTDRILQQIEDAIAGEELIESTFTLAGGRVWGLYTYEIANEGELNIQLVPRDQRNISTADFVARLRLVVAKIPVPGGMAMVNPMPLRGIRRLGDTDVEVRIRGQDLATLFELAGRTAATMNELDSLTNVNISLDMNKPEYRARVDRARAAELGVSVRDVADTMRSMITGTVATRLREGDQFYNIRTIIPEWNVTSRQDVENLILNGAPGGYLQLYDVAQVVQSVGPVEIIRENQVKQVVVQSDVAGGTVGAALQEVQAVLEDVERPVGYEFSYGGQALMMTEMQETVLAVLAFALFFSFVVLAIQFNSFKLPLLILFCVPFCLGGLAYALYLTSLPLGATVVIGALVVVAAMTNDGVLLLTFAGQLREQENLSPRESVVRAAKLRLRPIVMTTVPIIVGFTPLALNLEAGGEMLQPMAAGAIGGLLVEMVVALLFLPCLYVLVTRKEKTPAPQPVAG